MKHYRNLFINKLNTKDVDHFTTDTGLFLRRKTNGAFRKLCNIFTNATIIRADTPDYASDEEYYENLKPDRIPLSHYPLSTKKNANNIVVERYPKLDKDESYIFVGSHVCPEDIETMLNIIDRNAYLILGSVENLNYNPEVYLSWLNGMIVFAESMPFVIGTLYKWKSKEKQENCISYREFLKAGESQKVESPEIKTDDSAIIAYTGGTTGKAKGVLLSNRAANVIGFQYKHADKVLDFQKGERFLDIIPPFLAYGLFFGVHMALCTCLEDVLCPDPAPEHLPELFKKYKPNHLSGGPLHIEALMKDKKVQKMNLSFSKTVAYGGDAMNQEWEDAMSRFLKEHHAPYELTSGYGMTEMAGPVCVSNHKFSVMLPFFCNNIKIMDIDTGEELGYDQEGEICVSGPTMMLEYYQNPEATNEIIFEENGTKWLRTGDLGHVTKEGYFRLTGRLKRILWSVGADKTPSRVYPMEIENVLCKYSGVDKCAVVGRHNGEKGYLVIAYVTLKSKDIGENVETELRQLCRQELKENSWPIEYHFVEKLPTTGAGKIDFRTLEKWAENSDSF